MRYEVRSKQSKESVEKNMTKPTTTIPIASIILDENIYPRKGIDPRGVIRDHLAKMPVLANPPNADLTKGFTVAQAAEKHACPVGPEDRTGDWTEPMACPPSLSSNGGSQRCL